MPASDPKLPSASLKKSVGRHQPNRTADVILVQKLLNCLQRVLNLKGKGIYPFTSLIANGICDNNTVVAIEEFQKRFCHFKHPDGIVSPGKLTYVSLVAASMSPEAQKTYNGFPIDACKKIIFADLIGFYCSSLEALNAAAREIGSVQPLSSIVNWYYQYFGSSNSKTGNKTGTQQPIRKLATNEMPNVNVEEFLKRFLESDAVVDQPHKLRNYIAGPKPKAHLTAVEKKGLSKEAMKELLKEKLAASQKNSDNLREARKNGIRFIVKKLNKDDRVKDIRWAAYMLASICHESKFMPAKENEGHPYGGHLYYKDVAVDDDGSPRDTQGYKLIEGPKLGLGYFYNDNPKDKEIKPLHNVQYYGRGYIQCTWWSNYNQFKHKLKGNPNLTANPDLALDPEIAYEITVIGMTKGLFRHVTVDDGSINASLEYFLNAKSSDYYSARSIVNGFNKDTNELDCGHAVARIATEIESILRTFKS